MQQPLIQIVDTAVADAYRRGGQHLACHPGCSQCCIGIFPISQQDAERLREALATLEQTDPQKSHRIQTRASQSRTRLTPHFPGDPHTGILNPDYEDSQLFIDESEDSLGDNEPCPILDPATGTCDLYEARPILCRTFGPPMRTAEDNLATCELCFTQATTEEIAAAELDPTIPAQEAASNDVYNATHHLHGQTLVAYALTKPSGTT
ncbi:MAG: YkgJ family cysteine cluster protein [Edaphobacter sp.]